MAVADVRRAARKLADQQQRRVDALPADRHFYATVETVTPGGASDGNALVKVRYRDEVNEATGYPDSYTPVVGHRVLCVQVGHQWAILQHSIGSP